MLKNKKGTEQLLSEMDDALIIALYYIKATYYQYKIDLDRCQSDVDAIEYVQNKIHKLKQRLLTADSKSDKVL